jgi:hypothetical protein
MDGFLSARLENFVLKEKRCPSLKSSDTVKKYEQREVFLHSVCSPRERGLCVMKQDAYGDMYLWNRGVDRLVRVLQRLETAAIGTKQEMKAHEVRLEEIRAGLNAEFAEAMAKREREDQSRLAAQRTAWEKRDAM